MTPHIWQQISDTLTAEIGEGRYPPGDKLPSEAMLSRRFGVNRHTLRRALRAMSEAGLVHARRGAGVFVTGTQLSYRLGPRTRFAQNLAETGHVSSRHVLRIETLPASEAEATALRIARGASIHVFESLASADGVPISHGLSVFPADRLPGLPEALARDASVTTAFAACGIADYKRRSTRLTAVRASGATARHLKVPEGAPLLRTHAINVDAAGQLVEYGTTWFAADRVELVVDAGSFA